MAYAIPVRLLADLDGFNNTQDSLEKFHTGLSEKLSRYSLRQTRTISAQKSAKSSKSANNQYYPLYFTAVRLDHLHQLNTEMTVKSRVPLRFTVQVFVFHGVRRSVRRGLEQKEPFVLGG